MVMPKIDSRNPGQSTDNDCFKDPHGHVGTFTSNPHAGMGRDDDGNFSGSMSRGGESPDGEAYVAKYRPRGGGMPDNGVPEGWELNDDGDGYA
jgi:hypothetical protein